VVGGGLIMWWQHGLWILDPILGCVIGIMVLIGAWRLVRQAVDVLLEGVPDSVDIGVLRRDLAAVKGVVEVHDLHVWSIGSGLIALSAHVVASPEAGHHDELLHAIDRAMRQGHGIHHSTVQIESPGFEASG
jgi:cobalt-zinc-cadmium efflux system protein